MNCRRALLILCVGTAGVSCGDSGGPNGSGAPFFTASVDGAAWVPDTTMGILFGLSPDSGSLNLVAVRLVPGQGQTITLAIRDFPTLGAMALSDISGPATGVVDFVDTNSPTLPPPSTTYLSTAQEPGLLRITAHNKADSTVAGTFAFTAVTSPDTAPHLTVSGSFRLRYTFQQVYLPGKP